MAAAIPAVDWTWRAATYGQVMSGGDWIPFDHLAWLLDELQATICAPGDAVRVVRVHMPARHGKSQSISRWLAQWFWHWHPSRNIILTSYAAALAQDRGREIRDGFGVGRGDIPGCIYEADDPRRIRADSSAITKGLKNYAGGELVATGVGGTITGMGADLFVLDDPHKDWQDATSPAKLAMLRRWLPTVAEKRLHKGATFLAPFTRWHGDDAAVMIDELFGAENVREIRLPALAYDPDLGEPDEACPIGREPGEALCPELIPRERLEGRRDRDPETFRAMDQQDPVTLGGAIWHRDHFRFYTTLPDEFDELIQSWDLTFRETTGGSYVVGQVWGRKAANFYLLDQTRRRLEFTAAVAEVKRMRARWPNATLTLVEDKANGPALESVLRNEIAGLVLVNPQGGKAARARAVAPAIESGNVWLPPANVAPWVVGFLDEAAKFPFGGTDDQIDAASQALIRFLNPPKIRVRAIKRRR